MARDGLTDADTIVEYAHHEIHSGSAFSSIYSALADDTDAIEVRIAAPASAKKAHMVIVLESALAATAEMWIDTTKTDNAGNRMTALNRNMNSSKTSILTICHTPSGSQAGNANTIQYIGAATQAGKNDSGGGSGGRHEFVLEAGIAYLLKLTSRSDSNALSIILDWYEHTDKIVID